MLSSVYPDITLMTQRRGEEGQIDSTTVKYKGILPKKFLDPTLKMLLGCMGRFHFTVFA